MLHWELEHFTISRKRRMKGNKGSSRTIFTQVPTAPVSTALQKLSLFKLPDSTGTKYPATTFPSEAQGEDVDVAMNTDIFTRRAAAV